ATAATSTQSAVRETVPASGAAAQYQEAWDSGGDTSVAELAHRWIAEPSEQDAERKQRLLSKWIGGFNKKRTMRYQDIIDWCKK
ncbi:MAG: hypothetical protein OSB12_10935, partial [Planctomycetota bacterium]|nr:hypothetical protein [Planctomycetota bacterium]